MRGARLSTTQIYNTQKSLRTDDKYNVNQAVAKSYFQPELRLQYQSISA